MWATYSIIKLSFTYIERHWNRSWITFARRISVFILYSSRMKRKLWTKRWITWRRIILNFQYSSIPSSTTVTYVQYSPVACIIFSFVLYMPLRDRLIVCVYIDFRLHWFVFCCSASLFTDILEWLYADALRRLGSFQKVFLQWDILCANIPATG
jgi:hypothetical protein